MIRTALLWLLSTPALAEALPGAYVLQIEGLEFYASFPPGAAPRPGDVVELYRLLAPTGPGGGGVVEDQFLLGSARVVETGAGARLLRGRGDPELMERLEIGSGIAILREAEADLAPAPTCEGELVCLADCPAATVEIEVPVEVPVDPEDVADLKRLLAEPDPLARLQLAEAFIERHDSALNAVAAWEVDQIEEELDQQIRVASASGPREVPRGEAFPIYVEASRPERVTGATLMYRVRGDELWEMAPMVRDGDGLWRGDVPAGAAQPPGLAWRVEIENGELSDLRTGDVRVAPGAVADRAGPDNRIALDFDFAGADGSFARGFARTEIEGSHRIDRGPAHSFRLSGGRYASDQPGAEALTYIGFEPRIGGDRWSLGPRLLVGANGDGGAWGFQIRGALRHESDEGRPNDFSGHVSVEDLPLAGDTLLLWEARFDWLGPPLDPAPTTRIGAGLRVTNMPSEQRRMMAQLRVDRSLGGVVASPWIGGSMTAIDDINPLLGGSLSWSF